MSTELRPPLETLACPHPRCPLVGQPAQGNLTLRKTYGPDRIRYLRCSTCREEFSERRGTPLFHSKIGEARAVSVAEHLADGVALKATARLVKVHPCTVRRLAARLGRHAQDHHDAHAQHLCITALEMDERHGFAGDKSQPCWEGVALEPTSRFVLQLAFGHRDSQMIEGLMSRTRARLSSSQNLLLLTDGLESYAALFPRVFGAPYRVARNGDRGRFPALRYRIGRGLAHVQILKRREGKRVVEVETRVAHGSHKRVAAGLQALGYRKANTSAIERYNGTARRMNAHQVRRSLAFARRADTREALGWWSVAVYNWTRSQRGLRVKLVQPQGKKRYEQRSPAMVLGLAQRVWGVGGLMREPVYPKAQPG